MGSPSHRLNRKREQEQELDIPTSRQEGPPQAARDGRKRHTPSRVRRVRPETPRLYFFSLLSSVPQRVVDPSPILSYKRRGAGINQGGRKTFPHTRTHAGNHRDMGPCLPLSPFCNPYYELECKSTNARTGRRDKQPEPVKFSCPLALPSGSLTRDTQFTSRCYER